MHAIRFLAALVAVGFVTQAAAQQSRTLKDSSTITQDLSVPGQWKLNVVGVPASALPNPTASTLGGIAIYG